MSEREPVVSYLDETDLIDCPYGDVRRVVTAGVGGVANVHVVSVTKGTRHRHVGYDEIYYVLSGTGSLTLGKNVHLLRPGAVAVVPRGLEHELESDTDEPIQFIIFGSPAMSIDDDRAKPQK